MTKTTLSSPRTIRQPLQPLHILRSKRAVDPNQIFVYIAAILIVGFVFLYGFKAVNTFLKSSDDIQLAKFIKDFQGKAASVSTTFGSVNFLTIAMPSQFTRVCVINSTSAPPNGNYPAINSRTDCTNSMLATVPNQLTKQICDEWEEMYLDQTQHPDAPTVTLKNVYFIDQNGKVGYKDYIPDISLVPASGFVCTRDGQLRLEGEARVAMVSLDGSTS